MVALRRKRTHRNADKNGHYRWYDDYALPDRDLDDTLYLRRAHSLGAPANTSTCSATPSS